MRLVRVFLALIVVLAPASAYARGRGSDVFVVRDGKTVRKIDSSMGVKAVDARSRVLYRFVRKKEVRQLTATRFDGTELWRADVDVSLTTPALSIWLTVPTLVILHADRSLFAYERDDGVLRYRARLPDVAARPYGAVAYVRSRFEGGTATKWDLETGKRLWESDLAKNVSPDPIVDLEPGMFRARRDRMWRLFDSETGKPVADDVLPAKTRRVLRTTNTRYRIVGRPARLQILNRDAKVLRATIRNLGDADRIISEPSKDRLIVGSAEEVQLVDLVARERLCRFAFPVASGSTRLLTTKRALVADDTEVVRCFDLRTGALRWRLPKDVAGPRPRASLGPAGLVIEMLGPTRSPADDRTRVQARSIEDGEIEWTWTMPKMTQFADSIGGVCVEAIDAELMLITVEWWILD